MNLLLVSLAKCKVAARSLGYQIIGSVSWRNCKSWIGKLKSLLMQDWTAWRSEYPHKMHIFRCCPDSVARLPYLQVLWELSCSLLLHECSNNEHDRPRTMTKNQKPLWDIYHMRYLCWMSRATWPICWLSKYCLRHPGNSCGPKTEDNFWKKSVTICHLELWLSITGVTTVLTCGRCQIHSIALNMDNIFGFPFAGLLPYLLKSMHAN